MRKSNIAKIDSKGRILLPVHIRRSLTVDDGTEFVVFPEDGYVKILPLLKGKTTELRFLLTDAPGSLAEVAKTLADYGVNIILSQSRSLPRQKLAEWDIIADITALNGSFERVQSQIKELAGVRKMEVLSS